MSLQKSTFKALAEDLEEDLLDSDSDSDSSTFDESFSRINEAKESPNKRYVIFESKSQVKLN